MPITLIEKAIESSFIFGTALLECRMVTQSLPKQRAAGSKGSNPELVCR